MTITSILPYNTIGTIIRKKDMYHLTELILRSIYYMVVKGGLGCVKKFFLSLTQNLQMEGLFLLEMVIVVYK